MDAQVERIGNEVALDPMVFIFDDADTALSLLDSSHPELSERGRQTMMLMALMGERVGLHMAVSARALPLLPKGFLAAADSVGLRASGRVSSMLGCSVEGLELISPFASGVGAVRSGSEFAQMRTLSGDDFAKSRRG